MMEFGVLWQIILATIIVSLVSLVGVLVFSKGKKQVEKLLFLTISFSIGTMLSAALLDLIPEASEAIGIATTMPIVFVGMLLGFVIEKIAHWHHHHAATAKEHTHPLGTLTVIGDSVHNFFDGVAIAAAFMVSPHIGIATTAAITLHEIPQEIGDFGLLLFSGFSKKKAVIFNFISALFAVAGALLFFFFSTQMKNIEGHALALTAGMFLYVSAADLLPELHKEKNGWRSLTQLALICLGALAIVGIAAIKF